MRDQRVVIGGFTRRILLTSSLFLFRFEFLQHIIDAREQSESSTGVRFVDPGASQSELGGDLSKLSLGELQFGFAAFVNRYFFAGFSFLLRDYCFPLLVLSFQLRVLRFPLFIPCVIFCSFRYSSFAFSYAFFVFRYPSLDFGFSFFDFRFPP